MLLSVFSTAIIQMTCTQLNQLVQHTYFYQLILLTGYTQFFSLINKYRVFSLAMLAVSPISLGTLVIRGRRRLKYEELEKTMSKDKSDDE